MVKTLNLLLGLVTLLLPAFVIGQSPNQVQHQCGVGLDAGELIHQRLMANRAHFARQGNHNVTNGRSITYIPLSIHNVAADAQGTGRTSEATIMGLLCGLNAIYADQNIQFFIHNQIYNRVSGFIDSDARSFNALQHMYSYRVSGTLNLIIGASRNNRTASWYDPNGDFVFLLKSMLSSSAKTEAHEIGHFFTLGHTFYGWEGIDVEQRYPVVGDTVDFTVSSPTVGSFAPERNARTGARANCATTADGFCDTPADYYSYRKNCPYRPNVKDPYGEDINPDEANIMSYALDACVNTFSTEQKNAIAQDVAVRSWVSNTPANTTNVTGIPTIVAPLNNDPLGSINNPTVRLEWSPVTGATWYYIEVYGTRLPGLWLPNISDVVYKGILYSSNPYFDLPTTDLVAGKRYAWRIKALNATSTCALMTTYSKFEASASNTNGIKDLPIDKQMTFSVNANPVVTSSIPVTVYTAEDVVGSIRIYGLDGREVLTWTKQTFIQGESLVQLPTGNLTNGIYLAVLNTDRGQLQQKIVVQR